MNSRTILVLPRNLSINSRQRWIVVEFTCDEQGRVVAEKQNGKTVGSGHDANSNKTSLVYPSGKTVSLAYDALDRMQTVGAGAPLASYGYEGKAKVTEKIAGKVRMQAVYDDGRRPASLSYSNTVTNREILGRTMGWTKTDLKASETRSDENGKTEQYEYDALLQLKKVAAADKETSYEMDGVGNITERVDREKDVTRTADFQVNSRNQVTNYKGQALSYDLNGNLTEYVDQYVYNWKNQLVRVERASGGEVYFKYDALGRRVEKSTTAGFVKRYLYDGLRVVEERDAGDGLLTRYVYGNGLDEAVEVEKDRDGDGTLEGYTPVQNTVGSVVGIADKDGNLVERMDYSAYGAPTFIYDHASPEVDVVRVKEGAILIRFSEPVKKDKAQQAIKVKKGTDEISGAMTFEDEDRVARFTAVSPLPQNETLTVSISTDLEDLAQNKLNQALSGEFTYTGTDLIVFDRTSPDVMSIRLVSGVIYVEFSEEIDPATITGAVELSSAVGPAAGEVSASNEKTVKFAPSSAITPGILYTVKVKTGVKDLSGKSLSQLVTKTFNTSGSDFIVYQRPDPNHQPASYIGNTTLFQGREYDQETGLYYFRARYLNSELGRFLQPDPKGYMDSMNPYQSFGNNPGNFVDPFGFVKKIAVILGLAPGERNKYWVPPGARIPPNTETLVGDTLDRYYEKGPDYKALVKFAKEKGFTLEVLGEKDLWEEIAPFRYRLKENIVVGGEGRTIKDLLQEPEWGVIFVGHMALRGEVPEELALSHPRAPFERPNIWERFIRPPAIKNDFFLPLGCNSLLLDVPAGINFGGIVGFTELGTAEKAAPAFIKEYIQSGEDFPKAIKAARKEYIESRTKADKATILSREEWSILSLIINYPLLFQR